MHVSLCLNSTRWIRERLIFSSRRMWAVIYKIYHFQPTYVSQTVEVDLLPVGKFDYFFISLLKFSVSASAWTILFYLFSKWSLTFFYFITKYYAVWSKPKLIWRLLVNDYHQLFIHVTTDKQIVDDKNLKWCNALSSTAKAVLI